MSQRFYQVLNCKKACIEKVRNIFTQETKAHVIDLFTERTVVEGVYVFEIFFKTGQSYELYIAIDPLLKRTKFTNISSRLDTVSIGSIHYVDIVPLIASVRNYLEMRFRGYRLEKRVEEYLIRFVENNPDGYIRSVRKGSMDEDKRHKDFILECRVAGNSFLISFDLKNNKKAVEEARIKKQYSPTLFTTEGEIKYRHKLFDEKVLHLISMQFGRLFLGVKPIPEMLHVT